VEARRALAEEILERLLREYGEPQWRNPLPPLDELVSTILSQNTNDTNRDRAYQELRETFPTWEAVRDAPPEAVTDAIRTAGLANQKGPRIQQALRTISDEHGALDLSFLRDWQPGRVRDWLMQLKGVGPKTTSIVMLFSLDMPAFPVDTHVHRVTSRLGLLPDDMNAEKAHAHLERIFPEEHYYTAHLNLIRHGREICQARRPDCHHCVLQGICPYFQDVLAVGESGARSD
jgi:endonuclease-3